MNEKKYYKICIIYLHLESSFSWIWQWLFRHYAVRTNNSPLIKGNWKDKLRQYCCVIIYRADVIDNRGDQLIFLMYLSELDEYKMWGTGDLYRVCSASCLMRMKWWLIQDGWIKCGPTSFNGSCICILLNFPFTYLCISFLLCCESLKQNRQSDVVRPASSAMTWTISAYWPSDEWQPTGLCVTGIVLAGKLL